MIGETAELAVLLKLQDQLSGPLAKDNAALSTFGKTAGTATGQVTKTGEAMRKASGHAVTLSGGLSHLKGSVGGLLNGPLGFIGLTAGVLGFGEALKSSIGDAQSLGLAVEKLTGITGESIYAASAQIAVFEKYGITTDKVTALASFAEKSIGKLSETMTGKGAKAVSSLTKLDEKYGISLVDAHGKAVDFRTEVLRVADYYNSNATAGQKAALAALLFGRNYAQFVPVLKLGSKGILEAEQAARSLGLTLTKQNANDLKKYTENFRELGDTVHGALLQVGLTLVPLLSDAARGLTTFLQHGGVKQIEDFAKNGAAAIRQIAGIVSQVAGGIMKAWSAVPKPLQDLLITGLVANKVVKFAFGFSGLDILKTLGGGLLSKGGSPLNPLWVQSVGGGIGGAVGAAGAAEGAAGEVAAVGGASLFGIGTAVIAGIATAAAWKILVQDPSLNAQQRQVAVNAQRQLAGNPSASDIRTGLASIRTGIKGIEDIPGGTFLYQGQYDFLKKLEALYAQAYKDTALKGPKATPKQSAASEDASHKTAKGRDFPTKQELRDATKGGVEEGNRNVADRRSIDTLKIGIGLDLARTKDALASVEREGLYGVRTAVSTLQNVISGALTGGFGGVIAALHGISFPASVGGVSQLHNHPGSGAPPAYVDKGPGRGGGRARGGPVWPGGSFIVGEEGRERLDIGPDGVGRVTPLHPGPARPVFRPSVRLDTSQVDDRRGLHTYGPHGTGRTTSLHILQVHATVSARQNQSADSVSNSYGPTPTRAGAAGVLL